MKSKMCHGIVFTVIFILMSSIWLMPVKRAYAWGDASTPIADTTIAPDIDTSSSILHAGNTDGASSTAVLKFDFSDMPSGLQITEAILKIYVDADSSESSEIDIYGSADNDWEDDAATNLPEDVVALVTGKSVDATGGPIIFNLGNLAYIQDPMMCDDKIFTLILKASEGYTSGTIGFYDMSYWTTSQAPELTLVFEDNYAPTMVTASPTLPTIDEDQTTYGGQLVSAIVGETISDSDAGAVEGIAITGTSDGTGKWQYSIDGGTSWSDIGSVAVTSALLLQSDDKVRFVPNGLNATTGSITYRAWDRYFGSHGNKVSTTSNGGRTAFSTGVNTASITVDSLNDAPTLTAIGPILVPTNEDTVSIAQTVDSFVGSSINDVDNSAFKGIAIIAASDNGTWQYSTDNKVSWNNIDGVMNYNARLLYASDWVRFVPNGENATIGSITYRAWDQTTGTQGSTVDTTSNGGTTAFSTGTDTATIVVTAVNYAPVLTAGHPEFTTINEDNTTNAGQLVSEVLGDSITDADTGDMEGIAITGTSNGNGNWQYSIDGGTSWTNIGSVAGDSALLLQSEDKVRFVPNGLNPTMGSITYRAWDRTSGSHGSKVSTVPNGNPTAFSTATATATISVDAVNDAPSILDGDKPFPQVNEDATSSSHQLVSYFVGSSVTDVDLGALSGIAIFAASDGGGTWQYSIDNGGTWIAVGAVSEASALLLQTDNRLRFVPDGRNATVASITYYAWDRSSGTRGNKVEITSKGGTTAFSIGTATASINVTAVNDAPVLDTSSSPSFDTITADQTNNTGRDIATLLGSSITDVDTGALEGIAITGLASGNGKWQCSVNGGTSWIDMLSAANNNAILLSSAASIRFVPNGQDATTASITYRAWDRTSGSEGARFDASTNGSTTAFSTGVETATITVDSANYAPVLMAGHPEFTSISEDNTNPAGQLVSEIVGETISDADTGDMEGIAITGTSSGNGNWQYSTDGGTSWINIGVVAGDNALLLQSEDKVRFVPNGLNSTTGDITYRAWDRTSGSHGNKVSTVVNGNPTAFSTAIHTASITVTAVNDAPILNPYAPTIASIDEDAINDEGQLVSTIVGSSISDVDTGAFEGIAIIAASNDSGNWEYSLDNGGTWNAMETVSDDNSLLLQSDDKVRFVPDGRNGTTATISYLAWDRTSGTRGNHMDTSTSGGTMAFSIASDSVSVTVTSVNDAPILTPGGNPFTTICMDDNNNAGQLVSAIVGDTITDIEAGSQEGIAVTSTTDGNGKWQYSINGGTAWTDFGMVAENSSLLLQSDDKVRFVPDGQNSTTASITYRAWDRTAGSRSDKANTTVNGNPTAFSAATDTVSISVSTASTKPMVDITSTITGPTNASSIPVVITFSEEVTGFNQTDITVTNGTVTNLRTSNNIAFTVDISPRAYGEVKVDVLAGAAKDLTGYDNKAANQFVIVSERTQPTPASTPEPTSTPMPESGPVRTVTRQVNVNSRNSTETDSKEGTDNADSSVNPVAAVDIVREVYADKKVDTIILDQKKTDEALQKLEEGKQNTVQLVVDSIPEDEADEITATVNNASIRKLSDKDVALEIKTEDVTIQLSKNTVNSLAEGEKDLFFRVVPIKDEKQQAETVKNAINARVVKVETGAGEAIALGTPMTIETNYSGLKTSVTFSLKDITIPKDAKERQQFLDSLGVYINHSDGEQKFAQGTIIYDKNGNPVGIEIEINKFSTFTIVSINNTAPTATKLKLKGTVVIGKKLTLSYTYKDEDNDKQGASIIAWYRADSKSGKNKVLIKKGASKTYTITKKDHKKYILVEVTPIAQTGKTTGSTVSVNVKVTSTNKSPN